VGVVAKEGKVRIFVRIFYGFCLAWIFWALSRENLVEL
jgi:hypothetical protein